MSLNCHCYRCNIVDYSANAYFSLNNEDEQNLILQICVGILKAIQDEKFSIDISYNGSSLTHKQINNITQVENCIDREFNQLFRSNKLHKKINKLPISIWRIEFEWTDNDFLIKRLLKILREWFNPFTNYLQKIDNQKRNKLVSDHSNDGKLKQYLMNNLKNHFPGFEYIIEYSWKSCDNNNCYGDFIFASDSGIFIVIKAKWLNVRRGPNVRKSRISSNKEDKIQVSEYKSKVSEEFNGKFIIVLGVIFTNNLDENNVILKFVDDDGMIAKHFKEVYGFSYPKTKYESYDECQIFLQNRDNFEDSSHNYQTAASTRQGKFCISLSLLFQKWRLINMQLFFLVDDPSYGSVATRALSGIAAIVAAGYMFYQTFIKKSDGK
ncbi:hypothetical protein RhiirC2_158394 [Rhizophagus irregularis]|uniref:Uncharacterized protein n=1 Tax=Rhizophagus irregularis TaxID=588596 RepID=A0A2N1MMQ6_9GLOM|nr:hypothetical protein RhiirC2_158394 [Rhizophagus irregularis]